MAHSILVLNTGSTSTKLAVYRDRDKVLQEEYPHDREFLKRHPYMSDQLPVRQSLAERFVEEVSPEHAPFSAIVARGGFLGPIHSGGYRIDDNMVDYLLNVCTQEHASNVAACIAFSLKNKYGIPNAYIYDGITTDELEPIVRVSGIPDMPRAAVSHALNMRATAHKAAADLGKAYGDCTVLVVHLGGGFSMSLHKNGRAIDIVSDDEGPFSPERSGGQQAVSLAKYLETKDGMREKLKVIRGDSGLIGYFGTNDARAVEKMIADGDEQAKIVYEAMALQTAKAIAGLATVTCGEIDCIALTGGLAYSDLFTGLVTRRTAFIAPTRRYPGENEMESLAHGAFRILNGEEDADVFQYDRNVQKFA